MPYDWEKDLANMGFDEPERAAISSTLGAMNGYKCIYRGIEATIRSYRDTDRSFW